MFSVLIVFNGRRIHAWFKQSLKLERMFSPVVGEECRVSWECRGSGMERTVDSAPPVETEDRPAVLALSGASSIWSALDRSIKGIDFLADHKAVTDCGCI